MSSKSLLRHLVSAGLLVSGGILLGRLTGFLREVAVASKFGVSREADVVLFSLSLPDFLVSILMGGALAAALIPEFKRATVQTADLLFLQSSLLVGAGFSILVVLLIWQAEALIYLFAPGFDPASIQASRFLLNLVLWLMPLTALAGVTMSYLQSKDHFAIPALGTFIFNTTLVVALFFFISGAEDFKMLGIAVLIGGFLRWASQIIRMAGQGMQWIQKGSWLISTELGIRFLQALAAGSLILVLPVIARALSSLAGPGGFATINYSIRLIELPMGVALGVLASVLFPKLSEMFAQDRPEEGVKLAVDGILWVFIIAYTVILIFLCFGEPLTRLAFQWGAMPAEATERIARLVSIGIVTLPAQGILLLTTALVNSKRDTKLPFHCSLVGIIVFVPLAWFLFRHYELKGVMIALVTVYWLMMGIQIMLIHQRHGILVIQSATLLDMTKVLLTGFVLLLPFVWIMHTFQVPLLGSLGLAVGSGLILLGGGFLVVKRYRQYIFHRLGLRTYA